MAIINVTPDSFSGDGLANRLDDAFKYACQQLDNGADMLDIGGESSRPGSQSVSEQEELDRVVPLVEKLKDCGVPLSIDTVKPVVMRESLAAGADMINDINGFCSEGAVDAVRSSNAGLCLMHMKGLPATMQAAPSYQNVVIEVQYFFRERLSVLRNAGVAANRIVLDPGFGFGKTVAHNLALLKHMAAISIDNLPILAGLSRKSMLGAITGKAVDDRLIASVSAALLAVQQGAQIVRVHDVAATKDALAVYTAMSEQD